MQNAGANEGPEKFKISVNDDINVEVVDTQDITSLVTDVLVRPTNREFLLHSLGEDMGDVSISKQIG